MYRTALILLLVASGCTPDASAELPGEPDCSAVPGAALGMSGTLPACPGSTPVCGPDRYLVWQPSCPDDEWANQIRPRCMTDRSSRCVSIVSDVATDSPVTCERRFAPCEIDGCYPDADGSYPVSAACGTVNPHCQDARTQCFTAGGVEHCGECHNGCVGDAMSGACAPWP